MNSGKFNIVLEEKINSVEEVYNNLKNCGDFRKMFNKRMLSEVSWIPEDNKFQMLTIIGDDILDEIITLKSFDSFCEEFPTNNWYYGYIND